jgi:hypothetical protein
MATLLFLLTPCSRSFHTKTSDSAALIIDKPILDLLKVDMDTPLEITTDGKNLIISPVKDGLLFQLPLSLTPA